MESSERSYDYATGTYIFRQVVSPIDRLSCGLAEVTHGVLSHGLTGKTYRLEQHVAQGTHRLLCYARAEEVHHLIVYV